MAWWNKSLIPAGSVENLKTALTIEADERNKYHARAKWACGLSLLLMLTILAFPVGILLFLWAMLQANKAEKIRAADSE